MENVSMLPIAKLRRRNSDSGSIGCGLRASHTRKAANNAAPPRSGTATMGCPSRAAAARSARR